MKKYLVLFFTCLTASRLHASAGTEGASFLDIPVGAGPAALGSAYTALATDAYAPLYNPAGLGSLTGNEVSAQHLAYLESIHYEQLSFVHPLTSAPGDAKKGIGFSVQYLGSGDIAGTDDTGASIGNFSSHYAAYNLSYGQTLTDKLSLGITGKWINAAIDDVSANAFALDFGSLYRMSDSLSFAGSLTNVGTKLKFLSDGDNLPLAFHAAAVYKPTHQWTVTGEGIFSENGLASAHMGTEWRPLDSIALRVGYKTDTLKGLSPIAGLTTGVGIYVWGQELAYAFSPYGDLGNTQYFSLVAHFGADMEARRNLIQYQNIRRQRTVKGKDDEPEYQQLMQLLSDDDDTAAHLAKATSQNSEVQD
jgi:hypothetical protein